MKKKIIHAISFIYNDERVVVKSSALGRFRVPISEVVNGSLKTRMKSLTAKQVVDHDIIKNCDPTLYLSQEQRMRVYPGGDSSYLPAQVEGILIKHDSMFEQNIKIKPPKFNKSSSIDDYPSPYAWDYDDGYAD